MLSCEIDCFEADICLFEEFAASVYSLIMIRLRFFKSEFIPGFKMFCTRVAAVET